MIQAIYEIVSNEALTASVYKMVLKGDTKEITAPGQFINIKLDGFFLRRPISICDWEENALTIVYKVVGRGTKKMAEMKTGELLDCLVSLGNGYNTQKSGDTPLLIGGGVGIPPLYGLCRQLIKEGKTPTVVLGFNKKDEIFLEDDFRALGAKVVVATADGSYGVRGFVTDAIEDLSYTYFYTCGPEAMFHAVEKIVTTSGQYSFEERMGCGFGACMGCSCETKYGNKRFWKDGPVLEREEIIW